MFTIADIRDIAVQIEQNGEQVYRKAAEDAENTELAKMFEWMADEEKRHAQWFLAFNDEKPLTEEQLELEKMGRQLLKQMIAGQTFSMDEKQLKKVNTIYDMVVQSKSFEQDTILFYEFLQGVVDDEDVSRQLRDIIEEERKHHEQLEEMLETGMIMSAPAG